MNARLVQIAGITGIFAIATGVCLVGIEIIDGDGATATEPAAVDTHTPTTVPPTDAPASETTTSDTPKTAATTTEAQETDAAPSADAATAEQADIPAAVSTEATNPATNTIDDGVAIVDPLEAATLFLTDFVDAHRRGDVDSLRDTLHPAAFEHFGLAECELYLVSTLGSVETVWVNAAEHASYDFVTPSGPVPFDEVIRADLVFSTPDSVGIEQTVHLPIVEGELTWLTRCGQD